MLSDKPIINSLSKTSSTFQYLKNKLEERKINLERDFENIEKLIKPFIALRLKKKNGNESYEFNLGYKVQLLNLNQIMIQSFGLEMIFVIPNNNQEGEYLFGTFTIFYQLISLFENESQFEDQELNNVINKFRKSNKDLNKYMVDLGLVLFKQSNDKENLKKFISALQNVFQKNYIQKFQEILQILSAIIKLNHINDSRETNLKNKIIQENPITFPQKLESKCQNQPQKEDQQKDDLDNITYSLVFEKSTDFTSEQDDIESIEQTNFIDQLLFKNENPKIQEKPLKDQLEDIFQDLLGVVLNDQIKPNIENLLEHYSGKANIQRLNSNRVLGYAQYLYLKLIQSFFFEVGLSISNNNNDNKKCQATFIRYPDQITGGTLSKPYFSGCYIINHYRDLINCWIEILQTENQQIAHQTPLDEQGQEQTTADQTTIDKKHEEKKAQVQNQLERLVFYTGLLLKKNDQQSIKEFFKETQIQNRLFTNLMVQITHKIDKKTNNINIYQFDDFCQVNHYDIDENDKQILMSSTLQLFNNQQLIQDKTKQKFHTVMIDLEDNFSKMKKNQNTAYIYRIDKKIMPELLNVYFQQLKDEEKCCRNIRNNILYEYDQGINSDDTLNDN